jgi:hypothetical protein
MIGVGWKVDTLPNVRKPRLRRLGIRPNQNQDDSGAVGEEAGACVVSCAEISAIVVNPPRFEARTRQNLRLLIV